jgi:hypothetical protein
MQKFEHAQKELMEWSIMSRERWEVRIKRQNERRKWIWTI